MSTMPMEGRRVIDLTRDGIFCIPVFGKSNFTRIQESAPLHIHKGCVEIIYCLKGELQYETGNGIFDFRPGKIFVSRPNERHRIRTSPKGLSTYYLHVLVARGSQNLLNLPAREAKWLRNMIVNMPHRLFDGTPRISALFKEIMALYDRLSPKTPERSFRLRQEVTNLLWEIVKASQGNSRLETNRRLREVIDEMEANPGKEYNINDLAERTAMSPTLLNQRFKEATGLPPHAFQLTCRIRSAKKHLLANDLSITQIADFLGYPSPQHFATQFRAATGLSPREFRLANKGK